MKRLTKHKSYYLVDDILRIYANSVLPEEMDKEVKRWLISESHRKEKQEALRSLWENVKDKGVSKDKEKESWLAVKQKAGILRSRRFSLKKRVMQAAAVVIPALLLSGSFYYVLSNRNHSTEVLRLTDSAQVIQTSHESGYHQFDDGTEIWINKQSELHYVSNRRVKLKGEAYFTVANNDNEKFIIETGHAVITVLGTSFNIKAYPDGDESVISLYEGKLHLETADTFLEVIPGEEWVIDHGAGSLHKRITARTGPDWNRRYIAFENAKLKEIFTDLENRYSIRIIGGSDKILENEITLKFESNTNIHEVMLLISKLSGQFLYTIDNETVYID